MAKRTKRNQWKIKATENMQSLISGHSQNKTSRSGRPFTAAERAELTEKITAMREDGKTYFAIERELGISSATIARFYRGRR